VELFGVTGEKAIVVVFLVRRQIRMALLPAATDETGAQSG
jgi:hypothetical protein